MARKVRESLGVKADDRLLVVPSGSTGIIFRKAKKSAKAITEMDKVVYEPKWIDERREIALLRQLFVNHVGENLQRLYADY